MRKTESDQLERLKHEKDWIRPIREVKAGERLNQTNKRG